MPRSRTPLLDSVHGPHDVRVLQPRRLPQLAAEVRRFLDAPAGLDGAVELGIALHRVFDARRDAVVWRGEGLLRDVMRAYELLAGRREFTGSGPGGSGGGARWHSDAQVLSYAGGLARAFGLRGCADRHVVVVVDGSAPEGCAGWEALGALADAPDLRLVVVALEDGAGQDATSPRRAAPAGRGDLRDVLRHASVAGGPLSGAWRSVGRSLRELLASQGPLVAPGDVPRRRPQGVAGPVDGGSVGDVEEALRAARDTGRPVLVHCVIPSRGPAVLPYGVVGAGHPDGPRRRSWTSVFAEELAMAGAEWPELVAVHAAGRPGPELGPFADAYPDRVLGTGRTAAHATAFAAGLAVGGLHPVLALPGDSSARDLEPLARESGVTFTLGRADGAGRAGGTDAAALARLVPGLRCAAPRDAARLRAQLHTALGVEDAPTVLYVPEGQIGPDIEAVAHVRDVDILHRGPAAHGDVLIVSVGVTAPLCLDAARLLDARGVAVTVVDPGWIAPLPARLTELAAGHGLTVTVEDDGGIGGVAALLSRELDGQSQHPPLMRFSPPRGPAAGTPPLTARTIADTVTRRLGEPNDMGA